MENLLPNEFDLIVVGTGLIESTVSAAASRIGKTVLHIDNSDYYGGVWASFNLESIQKLCSTESSIPTEASSENGKSYRIGNSKCLLKDITQKWHIPEKLDVTEEIACHVENVTISPKEDNPENVLQEEICPKESSDKIDDILKGQSTSKVEQKTSTKDATWTQERLLKDSRKFNIDLAPKLQYARGDFVELLISSNIARYSEYRSVSRVLTYLNNELELVPCSRSDVFSNSKVSVIDKRMLMKLLTSCMDDKEFEGYKDKTFKKYLTDRKLAPSLIHYILYGISMCTNDTPCMKAVEKTRRFLNSLGRFGKTPFLYSMYGSGELPQAFCRMSAVFGGIYALNQPLKSLCLDDDNKFEAIVTGDQKISANKLVISAEKLPEQCMSDLEVSYISRAVFITDRSIMPSDQEHLTLLLFPSEDSSRLCHIIEGGALTGCCPKDLYLVYMFMKQDKNPISDFEYYIKKLFKDGENSAKLLWSFYYSSPEVNVKSTAENVYPCPGPDLDLDYDNSVKIAREIFEELYPNEEMLPRAPDPEEIIIGEE